jgi:hypothetical protein
MNGQSDYDVAQICLNGHVINTMAKRAPESNEKRCTRCGEETIMACQTCDNAIRGDYFVPGVIAVGFRYNAPAYCHNCGNPYPWTTRRLQAAKELAGTLENLSHDEQIQLRDSIEDLARDTPQAKLAESRFKGLLKKAGTRASEEMRSLVVDIFSEAVKKSLFPGP